MLWRFYIGITDSLGVTGYWSETTFIISLIKNIAFAKLFGTSFGSNILTLFTEFEWQGADTFGFIRVLLKFTFKAVFYINNAWILLLVISDMNTSHYTRYIQ